MGNLIDLALVLTLVCVPVLTSANDSAVSVRGWIREVKSAKRSTEELWKEIGELLNTVTISECANYFASSGYVST